MFDAYNDVWEFHEEYGLPTPNGDSPLDSNPTMLERETALARVGALQEELTELTFALQAGSLHEAADAVLDLIYFAIGTLIQLGFGRPLVDDLWREIQRSNMEKEASYEAHGRGGTPIRLVKPEGWTPPRLAGILQEALEKAAVKDDEMDKITEREGLPHA